MPRNFSNPRVFGSKYDKRKHQDVPAGGRDDRRRAALVAGGLWPRFELGFRRLPHSDPAPRHQDRHREPPDQRRVHGGLGDRGGQSAEYLAGPSGRRRAGCGLHRAQSGADHQPGTTRSTGRDSGQRHRSRRHVHGRLHHHRRESGRRAVDGRSRSRGRLRGHGRGNGSVKPDPHSGRYGQQRQPDDQRERQLLQPARRHREPEQRPGPGVRPVPPGVHRGPPSCGRRRALLGGELQGSASRSSDRRAQSLPVAAPVRNGDGGGFNQHLDHPDQGLCGLPAHQAGDSHRLHREPADPG